MPSPVASIQASRQRNYQVNSKIKDMIINTAFWTHHYHDNASIQEKYLKNSKDKRHVVHKLNGHGPGLILLPVLQCQMSSQNP